MKKLSRYSWELWKTWKFSPANLSRLQYKLALIFGYVILWVKYSTMYIPSSKYIKINYMAGQEVLSIPIPSIPYSSCVIPYMYMHLIWCLFMIGGVFRLKRNGLKVGKLRRNYNKNLMKFMAERYSLHLFFVCNHNAIKVDVTYYPCMFVSKNTLYYISTLVVCN